MLLQTNSYVVPKEKRAEHARLMRRFRQVLNRLGCDSFEVYEQVGANWSNTQTSGRYVQIMRFRDRKHQLAVQGAERTDPAAQELIAEFCELVNYPYQQQQGQFAVGFYSSVLPAAPVRAPRRPGEGPAGEDPQGDADPEAGGAGFAPAAAVGGALAGSATAQELLDDSGGVVFGGEQGRPLSASEQEIAADEFAQGAESAEPLADETADGEVGDLPEAGDFAGDGVSALADDDAALPTFAAESTAAAEQPSDDPAASDESTLSPEPNSNAAAGDASPVDDGNEEFTLDDLDGGSDAELTDDDLARLAQELADEPRQSGGGGTGAQGTR